MARPQKEALLKKSNKIDFRLSETEYALIESRAAQAGVSISEYVRSQIVEGKYTVRYSVCADSSDLKALLAEFRAIGSNLNQIARYFNMGGIHSTALREEIYRCISELMTMREKIAKLAGDYDGHIEASFQ